jgi:methionyl aminopeptidase
MTFIVVSFIGSEEIEILEDMWTAVSVDNARSAQFEHTILITENGAEILTQPD